MHLDIKIPGWATQLLEPSRYKGARGGRSSGKSHFMCERLVKAHILNPDFSSVCIREIQRSLKFSAKRLIESKIRSMGVSHLFDITQTEIKRIGGTGIIIFQGMQDHTAESIKSLEGFDLALVEEAQSLSARSLELLLPTIRKEGSEVWFIWNPDQSDDPVDDFLVKNCPDNAIVVHVNYLDNPFLPEVSRMEADAWLKRDPDSYPHVWLGEYNTRADDQVLAGCWRVDTFDIPGDHEPAGWSGPYIGADWGFASDPTAVITCWIKENTLYVEHELYGHGIETDDLPEFFDENPYAEYHIIRADNARPETISYMRKHGYPRMVAVKKWPGSVEDGVSKLRSFDEIVIDPECVHTIEEARLWRYKRDRLTGDILPVLIDKHNHLMDSMRYAIAPLIKSRRNIRIEVI